MQKWEYLSLTANRASDGDWHPRFVNETEVSNWEKSPTLHNYISTLGNENWELISEHFDPNSSGTKWRYHWLWVKRDWKELKTQEKTYKGLEGHLELMNEIGKNCWELTTATVETTSGGYIGDWLFLYKTPVENPILRLRFKRPKA